MTFKVTVHDGNGVGIQGLVVTANDEMNGQSFTRSTDGSGYADVAILGSHNTGNRVSLSILDPQYRFKGLVMGDSLVLTDADQTIDVVLDPFV